MTKVEVTYSYFPFSVRPLCTMVGFDKYHPEIIKFDFFQLKFKDLTKLRIGCGKGTKRHDKHSYKQIDFSQFQDDI